MSLAHYTAHVTETLKEKIISWHSFYTQLCGLGDPTATTLLPRCHPSAVTQADWPSLVDYIHTFWLGDSCPRWCSNAILYHRTYVVTDHYAEIYKRKSSKLLLHLYALIFPPSIVFDNKWFPSVFTITVTTISESYANNRRDKDANNSNNDTQDSVHSCHVTFAASVHYIILKHTT